MQKVERTITINASVEKVFARLDNPMNMLEDYPNIVDVTDITGEGVGKSCIVVYKMAGVKFKQTITCTEYILNKKMASKFEGGIKGSVMWCFKPQNGNTEATVTVEYSIPIPLIGKIVESVLIKKNEREWDVMLANVKEVVEADTA